MGWGQNYALRRGEALNALEKERGAEIRGRISLREPEPGAKFETLIFPVSVWQPKHLPYQIVPGNRWHFYENLWKRKGLDLLGKELFPAKDRTLLDYGCGRGETLQLFGDAGYTVMGTDVDPECVRLSGQFGKTCILDPADPVAQFGRKSFDVVTSFHVLEHVDSPKKTLSDLAQIARQYVVLAVPNLRFLHNLMARRVDLNRVNEGHLQSWDHWHLRNLAERHCGLQLVEWAFDATQLPVLSDLSQRLLGNRATIYLETGLFRRLFPFHGISVIGLFRVRAL